MEKKLKWKVELPSGMFRKHQVLEVNEDGKMQQIIAELPEGNSTQTANLIAWAPSLYIGIIDIYKEAETSMTIDNHQNNTEVLIKVLNNISALANKVWQDIK